MNTLKLSAANTIIDAALAEGRQRNLSPLVAAVLDAGGNLIAFKRDDGAGFFRFDIAFGKAWGALGMGFGTRRIAERAEKFPLLYASFSAASQGRIIPTPGGVIIVGDDGTVVGAVGVSGDLADNDEICALAGIKASGYSPSPV